jgi:hypothetical protein
METCNLSVFESIRMVVCIEHVSESPLKMKDVEIVSQKPYIISSAMIQSPQGLSLACIRVRLEIDGCY